MNLSDLKNSVKEMIESMAPSKEDDKVADELALQSKESSAQASEILGNLQNAVQDFYTAYRDSLGRTKDETMQDLKNERRNAFQNIMSSANSAGMMYSNFPERTKRFYDTNTYNPAIVKAQNTYQTGLDTLRSNVVNAMNTIADYNDEIANLNKQYTSGNSNLPKGAVLANDAGDYITQSAIEGNTKYFNSKNDPIRLGTVLRHDNITDSAGILNAMEYVLDSNALGWFGEIYKKAKLNGYGNVIINAGSGFEANNLGFLNDEERTFMDSLGLSFAQ